MARAATATRTARVEATERPSRPSSGRETLKDIHMEKVVRDQIVAGLLTSSKKFDSQAIKDSDEAATSFTGQFVVEAPAYNLMALASLVSRSNVLQQCVDSYVTNIEATGHHLEYIGPEADEEELEEEDPPEPDDGDEPPIPGEEPPKPKAKAKPAPKKKAPPKTGPESPAALAEKERIESFLSAPNGEYSFIELRERTRRDKESVGGGAWEVVRDATGAPSQVYHIPSHTLFMTKRDTAPTEIKQWIKRGAGFIEVTRNVHLRRYVQVVGGKKIYFKEFGDPRRISSRTGVASDAVADSDLATEILYDNIYRSGYTYGVPRYIHQLASIQGSRESELTNLDFFKNNAIPAMVASISGGQLTRESFEDIKTFFTGIKGKDAQNRFLVLEVEPSAKGASPKGALQPPRVDLKALHAERQTDALFQEYDKENQKKVRSAFRLPPIFLGLSEDLNYASAKASLEVSEQQVFAPERAKVDDLINLKLLQDAEGKPPQYWWVKSNPAKIVDPADIVMAMEKLDAVGALTPNMAINIANELFGLELTPIVEPWGDIPFEATIALMAKGKIKGFEDVLSEEYPPPPPPTFGAPPPGGDDPDAPPGDGEDGDEPPPPKGKTKPPADDGAAKGASTPARKRVRASGTTPAPAKTARRRAR